MGIEKDVFIFLLHLALFVKEQTCWTRSLYNRTILTLENILIIWVCLSVCHTVVSGMLPALHVIRIIRLNLKSRLVA